MPVMLRASFYRIYCTFCSGANRISKYNVLYTTLVMECFLTSKRNESKAREQTVIHCDRNNVDDVIDVTISLTQLISSVKLCCQWHWYRYTHLHFMEEKKIALRQSKFTMFRHSSKDGNSQIECLCASEMDSLGGKLYKQYSIENFFSVMCVSSPQAKPFDLEFYSMLHIPFAYQM